MLYRSRERTGMNLEEKTMRSIFAPALTALSLVAGGQAAAKKIMYFHNTLSGVVSKIAIPEHEVVIDVPRNDTGGGRSSQ